MEKTKTNKLVSLLAVPLLAIGCCEVKENKGEFMGYEAIATDRIGDSRVLVIFSGDGSSSHISAFDGDYDDRFDRIMVGYGLPRGHELESFTGLDTLEEAWDELTASE